MVVLAHFGGGQLASLLDLEDFLVSQANDHVFRLEVSVDHLAHSVHVVESDQALPRQSPHQRNGHSLVVVSFYNFEEVHTQNLEHHDEVLSVWTVVDERVQKLGAVRRFGNYSELPESAHEVLVVLVVVQNGLPPLVGLPVLGHLVQNIHFVVSCLHVMLCGLLYF